MVKIVEINRVKWKTNWKRIVIDSGEFFDVDDETVLKFNLEVDKKLSDSDIEVIKNNAEKIRGKETAFNYLTYSFRTEKEIRTRLYQKGISSENIEEIVSDLKRLKLINDLESAKYLIEKFIKKGYGRIYIRNELKTKGIKEEIIKDIVPEFYDENIEKEIAVELMKKRRKGKGKGKILNLNEKKKIADFLYRRGFNWEIINEVLDLEA